MIIFLILFQFFRTRTDYWSQQTSSRISCKLSSGRRRHRLGAAIPIEHWIWSISFNMPVKMDQLTSQWKCIASTTLVPRRMFRYWIKRLSPILRRVCHALGVIRRPVVSVSIARRDLVKVSRGKWRVPKKCRMTTEWMSRRVSIDKLWMTTWQILGPICRSIRL